MPGGLARLTIVRRARLLATVAAIAAGTACSNPFSTHYEYEEQLYLSVDGRATVVIDSSLAALVRLRALPIDPSPDAANDRDSIRKIFEAARCRVDRVSRLWTRSGRPFVQVSVSADDLRQLSSCGPLAWSTYSLGPFEENGLRYLQTVGPPPAVESPRPLPVAWDGSELVAFKLHAPSRIRWQNVKNLLDGSNGTTGRGNILTWEQKLSDRLAGQLLAMEVRMDSTSILHTTLWLFAGAFGAAILLLILIIWLVIRKGRRTKLIEQN